MNKQFSSEHHAIGQSEHHSFVKIIKVHRFSNKYVVPETFTTYPQKRESRAVDTIFFFFFLMKVQTQGT